MPGVRGRDPASGKRVPAEDESSESDAMPKSKTHSGAKKRFRVTRNGKVLHKRMNKNHMLSKKSASRKRRLSLPGELSGADAAKAKRILRGR